MRQVHASRGYSSSLGGIIVSPKFPRSRDVRGRLSSAEQPPQPADESQCRRRIRIQIPCSNRRSHEARFGSRRQPCMDLRPRRLLRPESSLGGRNSFHVSIGPRPDRIVGRKQPDHEVFELPRSAVAGHQPYPHPGLAFHDCAIRAECLRQPHTRPAEGVGNGLPSRSRIIIAVYQDADRTPAGDLHLRDDCPAKCGKPTFVHDVESGDGLMASTKMPDDLFVVHAFHEQDALRRQILPGHAAT